MGFLGDSIAARGTVKLVFGSGKRASARSLANVRFLESGNILTVPKIAIQSSQRATTAVGRKAIWKSRIREVSDENNYLHID